MAHTDRVLRATRQLSKDVDDLRFAAPVSHVYNPLQHAGRCHRRYVRRFAEGPKRVIFLGMNPGPYGMAQTGVPFGEVSLVRDWLQIQERVDRPEPEHPKRPVDGFDCRRSEVSGCLLYTSPSPRD